MHPPIAADLRPCADGSAVRTALVAWPRRCAPSWHRWDRQTDGRIAASLNAPYGGSKQAVMVMVATGRIAATAQIDPAYFPSCANVVPPCNTWFLGSGTTQVCPQTASRSDHPFLQGSRRCLTDRHANYASPSVAIGRIVPRMRCGLEYSCFSSTFEKVCKQRTCGLCSCVAFANLRYKCP